MNRLKYHTAYLAGPIDAVSYKDASTWRNDLTTFLHSLNLFVLDPLQKPIEKYNEDEKFLQKRKQLKKEGKYDELHQLGKPIRAFDLRSVDCSNFVIVYYNLDVIMAGTLNEMSICDLERKPCLIMCEQGISSIPDWWFFTFPAEFFFEDWRTLKQYIYDIDSGKNKHPHKRWWLIDYEKIAPPQLKC